MDRIDTRPTVKDEIKVERPRLHKVILVNDDYTPREFVVTVLKGVFRMSEDQAARVMIHGAPPRHLRCRGLHQGRRGNQSHQRHRCRPAQRLPVAVHHRAGRINSGPKQAGTGDASGFLLFVCIQ